MSASSDRIEARLRRVERKLDMLLAHFDLADAAGESLPDEVADALRRGRTIEAIKLYRKATGAGLAEAKSAIDEASSRL
ncbi:MAG: hypothetical protein AAF957_19460 [Planctomycetota bacterium]